MLHELKNARAIASIEEGNVRVYEKMKLKSGYLSLWSQKCDKKSR